MLRHVSKISPQFLRLSSNLSEIKNLTPSKYNKIVHEHEFFKKELEKTKRELVHTNAELASLQERFTSIEKSVKSMRAYQKNKFQRENNFKFTGSQPLVPFGM